MKYEIEVYRKFYIQDQKGPHGLTFNESTEFDKLDNQGRHDYFQWLFPTNLESSFNKTAPTLDADLRNLITSDQNIVNKLTKAAEKYIGHLKNLKQWPSPTDHNNLRLSRILRCFNLLDLTHHADEIYKFLLKTHEADKNLTRNNMDHFRSAMFNKTFFVVIDEPQKLKKAQTILSKTLPDHDLMEIEEDDIESFTCLKEPVLWLSSKVPRTMDKVFQINSSNGRDLTEYFLKFRFWY